MNIVLIGDSLTDMSRQREGDFEPWNYGFGYPFFIEGELHSNEPGKYTVYNRGIGGDRIVDIYARIKKDCWNLKPQLISLLVGINDVWHEIMYKNGVELDRFKKIYDMTISDTLKVLPNVKFMLLEPFVIRGSATNNNFDEFLKVKQYAKVVKEIALKYNLPFVPLQNKFDDLSKKYGEDHWCIDGVHPTVAGAKIIYEEWMKAFKTINF